MFLYTIITESYFFLIKIASLFNEKARKMIYGRKNLLENLHENIDKNSKYIWFHCASLGEFEQGRPLIEKLKKEIEKNNLNYKIILSFFSPSGYEIRKNYPHADIVCYMPFDKKSNAEKFINLLNPVLVIFVKYEIWFYHLNYLKKLNIPTYLISAVFRNNQIFFKPYGRTYVNALKCFTKIFVQNENSKHLLENIGIKNVEVVGDTRIDRVIEISQEQYQNKIIEKFCENKYCIVFGSTWKDDEKFIIKFINKNNDKFAYIIAPHEVSNNNIEYLERSIELSTGRLSKLETTSNLPQVIIVDSIGILSKIYRFANISYVGGGFGKGIHNILEPAVYGIPIIFGPNHKKFTEAIQLKECGIAFSYKKYEELESIIFDFVNDKNKILDIKLKSKIYFSHNFGTTDKILTKISFI